MKYSESKKKKKAGATAKSFQLVRVGFLSIGLQQLANPVELQADAQLVLLLPLDTHYVAVWLDLFSRNWSESVWHGLLALYLEFCLVCLVYHNPSLLIGLTGNSNDCILVTVLYTTILQSLPHS